MVPPKFSSLLILLLLPSIALGLDPGLLPKTLAYQLDVRIDYDKEKLYGTCAITIAIETDQPIKQIPILLYRLLTVKSVVNENNISLPFSQRVVSITDWEQIQANFIEISLNKPLSLGEQRTIKIEYEGYFFGYAAEGWRYVKDHIDKAFTLIRTDGFGYPVIGYPSDRDMMKIAQQKYDYLLNITVQNEREVVTAGELIDKIKTDDQTTFTFRSKKPSWRFDIAISDYKMLEEGKNRVYYFPSDSLGAKRIMNALHASYELYTGWFGPLNDYQGFSIIEVPEGYSSQMDVAAIILSAENFNPSKEMQIIYHEMAHMWNVTNMDDQPCRFETEGHAQFLQFLLQEKLDNKKNAVAEAAQGYLDRVRKTFKEKVGYQTIPIKAYGVHDMTEYSYTLGMVAFAIFYHLVGQDHFNSIIGSFYAAYYSSGATLDEFIDHCKKSAPIDLEPFFNDWIYTTNAIKLVVEGKTYAELIQYYKELK
jgi:hypothetical protein